MEPATLPTPDPRNGKAKLKLLERKIAGWPKRKQNEAGWIYVYNYGCEETAQRNYYKVGCTKIAGGPAQRVRQWDKRAQLKFSIYLERGYQWAERVIHLYLWYVRMYRYSIDDNDDGDNQKEPRFYSIWARDLKLPPIETHGHAKPPATHKQIEWFCLELSALIELIQAVAAVASATKPASATNV
jgi:hypothetical protein